MQILKLSAGTSQIEIWTIGARLNAASWGGFEGLVDGSATVEDARGPKLNHGCVVGPVANRIAGSRFELDGKTYRFPPNEGESTLCHSGDTSLRDRVWTVTAAGDVSAVLTAEVGDVPVVVNGHGEVVPKVAVDLVPQVSGKVVAVSPSSSPAAPSTIYPVHTDVVKRVVSWAVRTHSRTRSSFTSETQIGLRAHTRVICSTKGTRRSERRPEKRRSS